MGLGYEDTEQAVSTELLHTPPTFDLLDEESAACHLAQVPIRAADQALVAVRIVLWSSELLVVPEPDNDSDAHAVAVWNEFDDVLAGYLPRPFSERLVALPRRIR
jgi:hypothetical protein